MGWIKNAVAAFRFLTIFPLPGNFGSSGDDLRGALSWFPLVGLILGALSALGSWFAWHFLPVSVAAVVMTICLLSFSGAMHLDGLADSADGFFSARSREQMLAIMRDSRTGVMGVAAVVLVLLLKTTSLAALSPQSAGQTLFLMPLAGRCALVLMTDLLPYVRVGGGLATTLYAGRAACALPLSLVVLALAGYTVSGVKGVVAGAVSMLAVLIFSQYCRRKIGGATGDTLGASCELAETAIALSFVVS